MLLHPDFEGTEAMSQSFEEAALDLGDHGPEVHTPRL
jgi:hypothetical protein